MDGLTLTVYFSLAKSGQMRTSTEVDEPDDQDGSAPGGMCRIDVESQCHLRHFPIFCRDSVTCMLMGNTLQSFSFMMLSSARAIKVI